MIKIKKRFHSEVTQKQLLGTRSRSAAKFEQVPISTTRLESNLFQPQVVAGAQMSSHLNDILTRPKRTILSASQQEVIVVSNWLKDPQISLAQSIQISCPLFSTSR